MPWQHNIDPIAFSIGPLVVRWYALTYLGGILLGFFIMIRGIRKKLPWLRQETVEWGLFWILLGIVLCARIGDVIFYQWPMWSQFAAEPWRILAVWRGGLSFHGGLIGLFSAGIIYCRIVRIPFWVCADAAALAAPWGLMFGRLGNFLNGELFGRVSDLPWAMVFPQGGPEPRHPSQLYEAVLEGPFLFLCVWLFKDRVRTGGLGGICIAAYGCARFLAEFFREPDPSIGFYFGWMTNGQVLCLAQIAMGLGLLWFTQAHPRQGPRDEE